MGKQPGTPESARRTTRSTTTSGTAVAAASSPSPLPPTPSKPSPPAKTPEVSDPLQCLLFSFPGRKSQILDLIRFIGPPNCPTLPLLLYGSASTGKTGTVVRVLEHLKQPFVYVSCRSCHNPRILFNSVLEQLGFGSGHKQCKKIPDFLNCLTEALAERKKKEKEKVFLVFDCIEAVRHWENGSNVLSLLLTLCDRVESDGMGLIYISRSTPDVYLLRFGSVRPIELCFPDYSFGEIHGILMRNQANPKLYSSFLSVVLKPFTRVTRRIDQLASALNPLYNKYCEPLINSTITPDEAMKRRLFDYIQPHLSAALNQTFTVKVKTGCVNKRQGMGIGNGNATGLSELDFHMSVSAKYLLISAFLASRNPATLDAALFDSTGGCDSRKRKRKSSQSSIDKNNTKAEETLTKGPGTFPLERLIAIFQCITSVLEENYSSNNEEQTLENGFGLMSDVLLQLSTLCNSNFLCKSGNYPLEGSVRYRSMIDEDMALKVARSVNFPLSNYVYRR